MNFFQSVVLSCIEGITEFLPISSTGHMILASHVMGIDEDHFVKTFEVVIQLGAVLAIVLLYWRRLFQGLSLYYKLGLAFIPTAFVGFFAYDVIKTYLFNPLVVALALIIGGIVLVLVDSFVSRKRQEDYPIEEISYKNAFIIGCFQCISMIPGVSRAAATIIGGAYRGLSKKQATEFSFLLALPTMFAATGYDLLKTSFIFSQYQIFLILSGLVISFCTAFIVIKVFLKFVERYGFKHFGYYRIILGLLFLGIFIL